LSGLNCGLDLEGDISDEMPTGNVRSRKLVTRALDTEAYTRRSIRKQSGFRKIHPEW